MNDEEIRDQLRSQLVGIFGRVQGGEGISATPRYVVYRVERLVTLAVLGLSTLGIVIPGVSRVVEGEQGDFHGALAALGGLPPTFQGFAAAGYILFVIFWIVVFATKTRDRGPLMEEYRKETASLETKLEVILSDSDNPLAPIKTLQATAMDVSTRYYNADAVPWRVGPPGWEALAAARFDECWKLHAAKWRRAINPVQSTPQPHSSWAPVVPITPLAPPASPSRALPQPTTES